MAKNRIVVGGYTKADGTKVKRYIRRGPGSETYGQGYRWDKNNKVLVPKSRKPKRR